jgi:hypothetical protein
VQYSFNLNVKQLQPQREVLVPARVIHREPFVELVQFVNEELGVCLPTLDFAPNISGSCLKKKSNQK